MVKIEEREKKLLQAALNAMDNAYVLGVLKLAQQCLQRMDKFMRDVMLKVGFPDLGFALRDVQLIMLFCMVTEKLKK